ncbi:MAG: flagellar protein FliO/FliZ [Candidatus Endobugula sp.]|jgi:flagellar biosynthetic protein FliO
MAHNKKKLVKLSILINLLLIVYSSFGFSNSEIDVSIPSDLESKSISPSISQTNNQLQAPDAKIPTDRKLPNYGKDLAEMLFYLGLIVGLIFFLAWLVKKIGHNRLSQNQIMKVTACLPLSTKEKLMVVQIGDEQIVIGVAPGFVGHITSLKQPLVVDPDDVNDNANVEENTIGATSFATLLSRLQYGKAHNEK